MSGRVGERAHRQRMYRSGVRRADLATGRDPLVTEMQRRHAGADRAAEPGVVRRGATAEGAARRVEPAVLAAVLGVLDRDGALPHGSGGDVVGHGRRERDRAGSARCWPTPPRSGIQPTSSSTAWRPSALVLPMPSVVLDQGGDGLAGAVARCHRSGRRRAQNCTRSYMYAGVVCVTSWPCRPAREAGSARPRAWPGAWAADGPVDGARALVTGGGVGHHRRGTRPAKVWAVPVRSVQVPGDHGHRALERRRSERGRAACVDDPEPAVDLGDRGLAGVAPVAVSGRSATGLRPAGVRRPSGWLSSQLAATVAVPPRPAEGRA